MHDNDNPDCPLNDPETYCNPAIYGLSCTCPNPRDRCPVGGYQFPKVGEENTCPKHTPKETFTKDQLITEDDDYTYCL